jgi:transcriptional regulator with XRE-family HTH domain
MAERLSAYLGRALERSDRKRDKIAQEVGVDGSYLSRIKHDAAIPSRKVMERLIQALKLDPEEAWAVYERARHEQSLEKARERFRAALRVLKARPDLLNQELGIIFGPQVPSIDSEPYPYSDEEVEAFFRDPAHQLYAYGLLGKTPGRDRLTLREKRLIYALVQEVRNWKEEKEKKGG